MSHAIRLILAGATISLILIIGAPFTTHAFGLFTPFGGKIVAIRPCLGGGLVVATVLQPPFMVPTDVAAFPSPFLYHMMEHPGQSVLGLLGPSTWCATAPHRGFSAPSSFFYGTSI